VRGLWSPPFCGEDFELDIRLDGLRVKANKFCWYPYCIERSGRAGALRVNSLAALCADMRTLVMRVALAGGTPGQRLPVQILAHGGLEKIDFWGFRRQQPGAEGPAAPGAVGRGTALVRL